jgi:hypothetical protein
MRSRILHLHPSLLALIIAMATFIAIAGGSRAAATCCEVTFQNDFVCDSYIWELTAIWPNNVHDMVPLTSGLNTYYPPNCDDVTFEILGVPLPTTVNSCVDIPMGFGCCLHVCRTSTCGFTLNNGIC